MYNNSKTSKIYSNRYQLCAHWKLLWKFQFMYILHFSSCLIPVQRLKCPEVDPLLMKWKGANLQASVQLQGVQSLPWFMQANASHCHWIYDLFRWFAETSTGEKCTHAQVYCYIRAFTNNTDMNTYMPHCYKYTMIKYLLLSAYGTPLFVHATIICISFGAINTVK